MPRKSASVSAPRRPRSGAAARRPVRRRKPAIADGAAVKSLSGEDALIHRFFAPIATHAGAFGLTDDAAALAVPARHELVVTVDALVAGVHFFADDPPEAIAKKALRVNLSDLAAKAADPLGFLLAIALPESIGTDWLMEFAHGLADDAKTYAIALFGGDTVRTPGPLALSVTAFGTAPTGAMLRRAGARAGDRVVVTGTVGDGALGLLLRQTPQHPALSRLAVADRAHLLDRYLLPRPRNALVAALREFAGAAMDVSDGLAGDLAKLCAVSGVGARIDTALLPLSDAARAALDADPRLIEQVVTGGDDYEILATIEPDAFDAFAAAARRAKVPVTAIGEIVAEPGRPQFVGPDGPLALRRLSFSHF